MDIRQELVAVGSHISFKLEGDPRLTVAIAKVEGIYVNHPDVVAERLVVLWNLCRGIPTGELATMLKRECP